MVTPSLTNVNKAVKSLTGNMKVGQFYYCDLCHNPIYSKENGFVVHGNIYQAEPGQRAGLIGNNFPEVTPEDSIKVEDVLEKVYCLECFCKTLKIPLKKEEEKQEISNFHKPKPGYRNFKSAQIGGPALPDPNYNGPGHHG